MAYPSDNSRKKPFAETISLATARPPDLIRTYMRRLKYAPLDLPIFSGTRHRRAILLIFPKVGVHVALFVFLSAAAPTL
jgi:hypothetical protein